jgi:hypothetical protein
LPRILIDDRLQQGRDDVSTAVLPKLLATIVLIAATTAAAWGCQQVRPLQQQAALEDHRRRARRTPCWSPLASPASSPLGLAGGVTVMLSPTKIDVARRLRAEDDDAAANADRARGGRR